MLHSGSSRSRRVGAAGGGSPPSLILRQQVQNKRPQSLEQWFVLRPCHYKLDPLACLSNCRTRSSRILCQGSPDQPFSPAQMLIVGWSLQFPLQCVHSEQSFVDGKTPKTNQPVWLLTEGVGALLPETIVRGELKANMMLCAHERRHKDPVPFVQKWFFIFLRVA